MNALAYKIVGLAVGIAMQSAAKNDEGPFELKRFDSGWESLFEHPYSGLVTDSEAWAKVWAGHKGEPMLGAVVNAEGRPPRVDFEKSNVIVIFMGATANLHGFEVADVRTDDPKKVVIQLYAVTSPSGASILENPFAILEISKTKLPVEVQAGSPQMGWKVLGTFQVPKETPKKTD